MYVKVRYGPDCFAAPGDDYRDRYRAMPDDPVSIIQVES